jgi:hypothetical protein
LGSDQSSGAADQLLARSWDEFCDRLKAAGRIPFGEKVPKHEVDRTAGFRLLARNIALALQFQYENNDPLHPELMHYFDPIRKQGGDNTDALYVGAQINGTDLYRISGQRGSALYFAVTTVNHGDTPWGGGVVQTLFGADIAVAADGSFELWIGPEERRFEAPAGCNWIRTAPETFRITFRQFFADWENEQPMRARIDRIGAACPPPQLAAQSFADGLLSSVEWIHESVNYWVRMIELWKARRNEFLAYRQLENNPLDFTPGGEPLICYWQLPRDEALIVRVRPPKAQYWAVEFGNYWWETMDYRYRLSSTNCHYAQLEDDGELILVVSHDDPGLPNWLDPSGFAEGYVTFRWILADHYPVPQSTQVKRDQLFAALPPSVKRIDAAARVEQLAERRRGIVNRFGA